MSDLQVPQSIQLSVDDSEKIELAEIQAELNESRSQNDELEAQLVLYRQNLKRCENTQKAISQLDSETTTWMTIGKMFVKNSRADVEGEIAKELKMYQKKVSDLETAHRRVLDKLNIRQQRFDQFVEKHRYDPSKEKKDKAESTKTKSLED